jgi:hypothetical protein
MKPRIGDLITCADTNNTNSAGDYANTGNTSEVIVCNQDLRVAVWIEYARNCHWSREWKFWRNTSTGSR